MNNKTFVSSGRLILQLGEQLIKDEIIALVELIKNSYDADASVCEVKFLENQNKIIDKIIIKDNGCGMTRDIIENCWFTLGSNYKRKKIEQREYTAKYKRLPIGEKGIGRLGLSKLGWKAKIITKAQNHNELEFLIDWKVFNSTDILENISVNIVENETNKMFQTEGTYIEITDLKSEWNRGVLRKIYREILNLQSPFKKTASFRIIFNCPNKIEIIKDMLTIDDIMKFYLYKGDFLIEKNIAKINYEFKPLDKMDKLEKRTVQKVLPLIKKSNKIEDNKEYILGEYLGLDEIGGNILIFDKSHAILKQFVDSPNQLKSYLAENGGVKVFRDGTRIYDYGSKGNDWLDFDRDRVNFPGEQLSNAIVLGNVELKRESSLGLEEKTNREGFIENETYDIFKEVLKITINEITRLRNADKENIRKFYGNTSVDEPVVSKIKDLKDKIEKLPIEQETKDPLIVDLNKLNEEYENVCSLLNKAAGQGLSLGIIIHELQKRIDELIKRVEIVPDKDIQNLTINIGRLLNGYRDILKVGSYKKLNIIQTIDTAILNVQFRLKLHEITLIDKYKEKIGITIKGKEPLIISSVINIIDNSIYWLDTFKIQDKKILIDIINVNGYKSLLIADNGKGFTIPPEMALKPMVTGKDEKGIGLGLFIVSESMKAQKGYVDFYLEDYNLPLEFKEGAKILLVFREE